MLASVALGQTELWKIPGYYPVAIPGDYTLNQHYPNPFNPTTTIRFDIPVVSLVTLKMYNIIGQEVATLMNQEQVGVGRREIEFNANSFASGVYFYRLVAIGAQGKGTTFSSVKRMILLK